MNIIPIPNSTVVHTPSQSQCLIELGVDQSKASENTEYGAWADSEHGKPIFTLTDILSLMPKELCERINGDKV